MTIRSRPATDEYRDGWDRVFGKKGYCWQCGKVRTSPECDDHARDPSERGGVLPPHLYEKAGLPRWQPAHMRDKAGPFNPHDADTHPEAD